MTSFLPLRQGRPPPPRGNDAFSPVSYSAYYFRKKIQIFQTPWKIFLILPFPQLLDFHPPKCMMTSFLVIDYKFLILPYFRCLSTFPPISGKNYYFPHT